MQMEWFHTKIIFILHLFVQSQSNNYHMKWDISIWFWSDLNANRTLAE